MLLGLVSLSLASERSVAQPAASLGRGIALIVPAVHLLGRSDGQAPAPGGQLELSL